MEKGGSPFPRDSAGFLESKLSLAEKSILVTFGFSAAGGGRLALAGHRASGSAEESSDQRLRRRDGRYSRHSVATRARMHNIQIGSITMTFGAKGKEKVGKSVK
jgi:hypothetical protein